MKLTRIDRIRIVPCGATREQWATHGLVSIQSMGGAPTVTTKLTTTTQLWRSLESAQTAMGIIAHLSMPTPTPHLFNYVARVLRERMSKTISTTITAPIGTGKLDIGPNYYRFTTLEYEIRLRASGHVQLALQLRQVDMKTLASVFAEKAPTAFDMEHAATVLDTFDLRLLSAAICAGAFSESA